MVVEGMSIKSVAEELEKQVEDIAKKFSSVNLDNSKSQVSFTGGNEIMDHGEPIKNLLENVKGLKKREGRKGGKRPKSWVKQQPRRKKKSPTKHNTRQQLSKVLFLQKYKHTDILNCNWYKL